MRIVHTTKTPYNRNFKPWYRMGFLGVFEACNFPAAIKATTVGSVLGGYLPMYFIKKGWPVFKARKTAMLIYAFCVLPIVFAQIAGSVNMWGQ